MYVREMFDENHRTTNKTISHWCGTRSIMNYGKFMDLAAFSILYHDIRRNTAIEHIAGACLSVVGWNHVKRREIELKREQN